MVFYSQHSDPCKILQYEEKYKTPEKGYCEIYNF